MKKITLPAPTVINEKEISALEMLEDLVMIRQAWRIGDGPKHAEHIFAAFDKAGLAVGSGALFLPDKAYNLLSEQIMMSGENGSGAMTISPRAANRFFLRIVRAVADAEEIDETKPEK